MAIVAPEGDKSQVTSRPDLLTRLKQAGRIIFCQEGVGLSMLRNIKKLGNPEKHQRKYKAFRHIFVT